MHSRHADTVIRAHNFQNASRTDADIKRIIMHTTEGANPERPDTAENVASFFANPTTEVSAHYVVDNNSVVSCVEEEDIAFHALGDNAKTIGIEQAGKAGQSKAQWDDAYSLDMLANSAELCADICKRRGIPVRFLSDAELRDGKSGFASHDAVSRVFGANIRDDPGPHFPWSDFLADVKRILEGDDMVRFQLDTGEGEVLAQSSPVDETFEQEQERLASFLTGLAGRDEMTAKIVRETRDDRDVKIRRVQAD